MVVIVVVVDPKGTNVRYPLQRKKNVSYVSCVFIDPTIFYRQVEPGDTFATTKEGELSLNFTPIVTRFIINVIIIFQQKF